MTLLFALATLATWAQQGSVRITGKITDPAAGAPVIGATITVEGAAVTATTDVDGNFLLNLTPGRKYTIRVSHVGYQTRELNEVEVSGNAAPLALTLTRNNKDLQAVVITSSARRENIATLYATQKNAAAISDGVSAEVIRKSPDRNTSEVLKRVSGASIQDNKFVVIRGLNERYNASLLNNALLPSTEPDKKAFSFDIIPSSLIDNVTIYKSPTPDLPGDFAGGAVKVSTRDYPAHRINELNVSMSYNSQTTFQNFYKGRPEGRWDWLGFFDNSRLIPNPYYQNRGATYSSFDGAQKAAITKLFPNTYGAIAANQSQPNFSVGYTGGNTKVFNGRKLGYIFSVNYSNGRRVVERERDQFESYDAAIYNYHTSSYEQRSALSSLLNLTYSFRKSRVALKTLFNNDFTNTISLRNGLNTVNPGESFRYKSQNTEANANGLFNAVLEGNHGLAGDWTVDWNLSYGATYRWQPDQRILTFASRPNTEDYFIKLNNENSPVIEDAGRIYSYLRENIYSAAANAQKQFQWRRRTQKLKAGLLASYRNRDVDVEGLGLATQRFGGVVIPESKTTTFENLFTPANIDQYNIIIANIPIQSTSYTGEGRLGAAYVLLDNRFTDKLRVTWGARAENYRQELRARGKANLTRENTDLLPSLLLTFALTPKTNLRLAGSQAVNRPEFRELATYQQYDYENAYQVFGNDQLVRSKVTNADLRYEWFPAAGEIFSASVFYKYFVDPIEQVNRGNNVLSYKNASSATNYGVEVELRKRLGFVPGGFFERLVFYTNAAYIHSDVRIDDQDAHTPLQGQSPYLVNAGLTYTTRNDRTSVNLLYNRIGERLRFRSVLTTSGSGSVVGNIFENARDLVDLQLSQKLLHDRLEVKLTVADLLAQPFRWYTKFDEDQSHIRYNAATDRVINQYRYGTTCTVGIRYSFK